MTSKLRVMLADDHALVREGLRVILEAQPDIEVVGEAASGQEAVEKAGRLKPDIVMMDLAMPGMNGIEATRRIKQQSPDTKIRNTSPRPIVLRAETSSAEEPPLMK